MFPPEPTKDPYTLLQNVWASLSRAADAHWSDQANVVPAVGGGYTATIRTKSHISDESWAPAAKYIRSYVRASHWKVTELHRKRGYIEMALEHAPPKPRPMIGPVQQKTGE